MLKAYQSFDEIGKLQYRLYRYPQLQRDVDTRNQTVAGRFQRMGIPSDRIFSVVMGISAALAALAGILAGPFLTVQPTMWLLPIVKAFAIVVVGGLGSIPGSILAALMLGYAETIVGYTVSTSWTEIVSVLATLLMLMFRPAGIFGRRAAF